MRKKAQVALGGALTAALIALAFVVACTPQGGGSVNNTSGGGGGGTGTSQGTETVPLAGMFGIISDWSESTHAVPVTFAAEETGCVECHDGRAFAMGVSDPKSFEASSPFGPYVVATDCRACHTGRGVDALRSGTVTTPSSPTSITAGLGSLCISCHRERGKPSASDTPRRAPHPSVQAAVYLAYGGIRQPGVTYGSTVKHTQVKNMCVGCHMLDANGVPTHTFLPTSPQAACGGCHQGVTDFNRKAAGDYDGNGTVGGIQDEVTGLLDKLNAAAAKQAGADTLTESGGQIVFKSGDTTVTDVSDKVYQAAYNWALVTNDKSLGVHNPQFTVSLLQQSYVWLTGSAIPNAKPFPGSKPSSGTPSGGEATGTTGGGTTATGTTGGGTTATGTGGTSGGATGTGAASGTP